MLEALFKVEDPYTGKKTSVFMQTSLGPGSGWYYVPGARSPYTPFPSVAKLLAHLCLSGNGPYICPYTGAEMRINRTGAGLVQLVGGFDPSVPFQDVGKLKEAFSRRGGVASFKYEEPPVIKTAIVEEPFVPREMPTEPKPQYMEAVDRLARKKKRKVVVAAGG